MFVSNSENETIGFGLNLAKKLKDKDVVCIYGDLGAGKTCLVKGIVEGLGISDEYVRSPTFAIINKYSAETPVYHLDFYRVESAQEIGQLGIEEFSGREGITLIEWPEKALKHLPQNRWEIKIDILGENKRGLKTTCPGGI